MPLLLATSALGTRVELVLDEPETPALRAIGEEAIAEVHFWHDRLSFFQPESLLSFINRSAGHRAVRVDEDVWGLLSLCDRVHGASGGSFDPAAAGLVRRAAPGAGVPPSAHDGPADSGWAALVELDEPSRSVRFRERGVRLDLGAVAKGFALDRAAEALRAYDVGGALLHAGTSSVVAIGASMRRLGLRAAGSVFRTTLRDGCLSVSAPRGGTIGGVPHVLRVGDRMRSATDTAVCVGPASSAAETDAWSTALAARGARPARMPERLRSAIHDGRAWTAEGVHITPAPEAA